MHPIDLTLDKAIQDGVFPGASLLVSHQGEIVWNQIYGQAQTSPQLRPLNENLYFDIASLTKPICTTTLCMLVVQEEKIDLGDPVQKYLPDVQQAKMTISQLLNHTSGLAAWRPYHEKLLTENPEWIANSNGKKWLLSQVYEERPESSDQSQVIYSDLGYILLGALLEKIYQMDLDTLFRERIANPLQLNKTFFNPLDPQNKKVDSNPEHFVPTENCPWRKKLLCGEVMDGAAYVMGGIAGHAGLFSTAKDILQWLSELQRARNEGGKLISQETFNLFCLPPSSRDLNSPFFTLGFDTPSVQSSAGRFFSPNSIGHLAFTGCSFWWNLEKDLIVIFLTNRAHPSRKNQKIRKFRPRLHDVIFESFGLI